MVHLIFWKLKTNLIHYLTCLTKGIGVPCFICHCFDGFGFFDTHHHFCFFDSFCHCFDGFSFFLTPAIIFVSFIVLISLTLLTPFIILVSITVLMTSIFDTHHYFHFFLSLFWWFQLFWYPLSFLFLSVIVLMASGLYVKYRRFMQSRENWEVLVL